MFHYDFSFDSLTAAQSGRSVLTALHVPVRLLRAPRAVAARGCGYVLRVQGRDGARTAELLRRYQVAYSHIFRVLPDGGLEEAAL